MKKKDDKWEVHHEGKVYTIGFSDVKEIIKSNYVLAKSNLKAEKSNYIMTKAMYFTSAVMILILFISIIFVVKYYTVFKFLNNEQFLSGLIKIIYGG